VRTYFRTKFDGWRGTKINYSINFIGKKSRLVKTEKRIREKKRSCRLNKETQALLQCD